MTTDAPERRRHARVASSLRVELLVEGEAPREGSLLQGGQLARDLSEGGLFVACASPAPLGARLVVRARTGEGIEALLPARVVRVRWGGREAGRPVSPGVALAFEQLDGPARDLLLSIVSGDTRDRAR